ncbi:MAG TPA: radical SAM protein [Streptosporangiaceae bacterium]|nr:radical SAM protein [Streptosporangiaceae bacterium]
MLTAIRPVSLSLDEAARLAASYGVPVEDALLIAVNLFGISSGQNRHRARVTVRLSSEPDVPWMVIVPLNAVDSPFRLSGQNLYLGDALVGHVRRIDADEAVGGYFRDGGRAATLNPNARSRCVGCAFCPNTLEAAADPRLSEERELTGLLAAMVEQHPRRDLTELREVTISTGCFHEEHLAVNHLVGLRSVLADHGVTARVGFLTSVIRSDAGFAHVAEHVSPFVLRLTAECFTRRDLLLKVSKARLPNQQMPDLLRRARRAGLGTSFTYIVGLDPLPELRAGIAALSEQVSEFPNIQVYQAHNSIMAGLRTPGADQLDFYLRARVEIEGIFGGRGLRPQAWECYRPLWYFTFAGERLVKA